jgi:hypothetical protein
MFTLITSWYHEPDAGRRAELLYCLARNLEHPLIKKVRLVVDGEPDIPYHPKIKVRQAGRRALFKDLIRLGNELQGIAILANTDIYFDESLAEAQYLKPNDCYALTRWDVTKARCLKFYGKECSQDAWIYRPKLRGIEGNYCPGKPGCDNRLAYELTEAGIRVTNPSKTIKACHLHLTNLRRYSRHESAPGPYLTINPTTL